LHKLVAENQSVRALCRHNSNFDLVKDIHHKIEWCNADILDLNSLQEAFINIDEVYHTAAMVSFQTKNHQQMMKVNVEGTTNLGNLALENKIKKFAFISSVATLGRNESSKFIDEKSEWQDSNLNTQYACSKMLAEREVWRCNAEGLQTVIVNPCIMLGNGNWNEGSASFFKNIFNGLKFYTEGVNAFVGVEDAVNITVELMAKNIFNERFIIAENNYSYHQVFNWIAQYLNCKAPSIEATKFLSAVGWRLEKMRTMLKGKNSLITKETATTAHLKCYYSNEKIKNTLQYSFTPIEQVIEKTAHQFLESVK
jgi:dihydroflavonol-4-reductase